MGGRSRESRAKMDQVQRPHGSLPAASSHTPPRHMSAIRSTVASAAIVDARDPSASCGGGLHTCGRGGEDAIAGETHRIGRRRNSP